MSTGQPRPDATIEEIDAVVQVLPARWEWLEALASSDQVFEARFGITVAPARQGRVE